MMNCFVWSFAADSLPVFHVLPEGRELLLGKDELGLEMVAGVGLVQRQRHHVVLRPKKTQIHYHY